MQRKRPRQLVYASLQWAHAASLFGGADGELEPQHPLELQQLGPKVGLAPVGHCEHEVCGGKVCRHVHLLFIHPPYHPLAQLPSGPPGRLDLLLRLQEYQHLGIGVYMSGWLVRCHRSRRRQVTAHDDLVPLLHEPSRIAPMCRVQNSAVGQAGKQGSVLTTRSVAGTKHLSGIDRQHRLHPGSGVYLPHC